MKFVVEIVYPNIFRKFAPTIRVEEFSHAVEVIRYIRAKQHFCSGFRNYKEIFSYKIILVKE